MTTLSNTRQPRLEISLLLLLCLSQTSKSSSLEGGLLSLTKPGTTLHRILNEDNNDDFVSLLVDSDGNEYEPYSLAWRYLGIYMDCDSAYSYVDGLWYYDDDDNSNNKNNGGGGGGGGYVYDDDGMDDDVDLEDMMGWYRKTRRRLSGSGDGDDCTRKVLWAAYHDPRYKEGQIGEYQYYNFTSGDYTKDFCTNTNPFTGRCVRMDCHEPNTHMKLIGVYKEADGLVDWAEQLFKHHGYCLWGEDNYEFMENYREFWPTYCRQLYYSGEDGSTLYMDLQPVGEGNLTVGIYSDEYCMTPSGYTFGDYILMYYSYYGYYDKGYEVVQTWDYAIATWNQYMNVYKICQPCRTYNLYADLFGYAGDDDDASGSGSQEEEEDNNNRMRFLGDENDGEGEAEKNGYDCYDDAGYTNCNQCYKFETKTDLDEATIQDLERADKQGTILAIKVNGRTYGKGGFRGPAKVPLMSVVTVLFFMATAAAFTVSIIYILRVTPLLDNARDYCSSKGKWLATFLYWVKDKWANWGHKRDELERPHYHIEDDKDSYKPPPTRAQPFNEGSVASFHTAQSTQDERSQGELELQHAVLSSNHAFLFDHDPPAIPILDQIGRNESQQASDGNKRNEKVREEKERSPSVTMPASDSNHDTGKDDKIVTQEEEETGTDDQGVVDSSPDTSNEIDNGENSAVLPTSGASMEKDNYCYTRDNDHDGEDEVRNFIDQIKMSWSDDDADSATNSDDDDTSFVSADDGEEGSTDHALV